MPRKLRQLRSDLLRAGFRRIGGRGSHTVFAHVLLPALRINIAGQDGKDAQHYQEDDVRQALRALAEARARQK